MCPPVMHTTLMAALKTGGALTAHVGDAFTGALATAALLRAQDALEALLWDADGGYYSDSAVMTDEQLRTSHC